MSVDIKKLAKMDISADKLCRLAGDIIFNTHACWQAHKVILVGDDVDITDIDELVWAYATRYHPGVNECLYDAVPGNPLVPYLMREWLKDLTKLPNRGGRVLQASYFLQIWKENVIMFRAASTALIQRKSSKRC